MIKTHTYIMMTTVRNRVTNSRSTQNEEEDTKWRRRQSGFLWDTSQWQQRKLLTSSVVSWCGNRNMMALLPLARDLRSHAAVCVLSSPGSGRVVRTQTLTDWGGMFLSSDVGRGTLYKLNMPCITHVQFSKQDFKLTKPLLADWTVL